MFEYTKAIFNNKKHEPLVSNLTLEQKKKYRKQYKKQLFYGFLYSVVYLGATVELINLLFAGYFWALALTIVVVRDWMRILFTTKEEIELIEGRIHKRHKKNLKQQRGENK